MYQQLRSSGTLSYANVETRFEEHQAKWPEAIFNEDAWSKYIGPLINPDEGKESTAVYLPMAQGSKAEQRKWWLYNRFRYMDSKWLAGDARNDVIQLRGYAKADITLTPYTDIYPSIRYGSYTVSERGTHGVPTTLACPIDTLNDTEIYIYSAPQLASVGDLSPLKVGFADFSKATNLQSIVVGSAASGYENRNLTNLNVGSNSLLRTIDARNCPALTGALDFSGATNVEHVYLDGTSVTSVLLPVGGILKTLRLPSTVTSLTVRDQRMIETFAVDGDGYGSITTLRVENSSSVIPVLDILDGMPENSRVRIIGFTAFVDETKDVEDFFDYLDTMRGLDEAGNNLEKPVVAGTIAGLGTITGEWLARMNARYPDVTITYNHINSTLRYYSYDGSTLITSETVTDGGNGTYTGTPSRTSTAQYSYSFAGWSLYQDQSTADPNATKKVTADRDVYAAYTATLRTYMVTWKNADGTTLETDTNVPYGSTPHYDGATPTQDGQTATGWTPTPAAVTGDVTYTAVYIPRYIVTFQNNDYTNLQRYYVPEGEYVSYSGQTPTYAGSADYYVFNKWSYGDAGAYYSETEAIGPVYADMTLNAYYKDSRSQLMQYLEGTLIEYDSDNDSKISKKALAYKTNGQLRRVKTSASIIEDNAISGTYAENVIELTNQAQISIGSGNLNQNTLHSLIIHSSSVPSYLSGMLNSTRIARNEGAIYVPSNLVDEYKANTNEWGKYLVLPIDEYPAADTSTLHDVSWSEIIEAANDGTASERFSLGDTKTLDLGARGKMDVQIVGFNVDQLASDGSTYAGISFITKMCMIPKYRYALKRDNPSWEASSIRAHLENAVMPFIQSDVRESIKEVRKYTHVYNSGPSIYQETADKLWIPSYYEIFGNNAYESNGPTYTYMSSSSNNRIKCINGGATTTSWMLRTTYSSSECRAVSSSGSQYTWPTMTPMYFAFGFCI